MDTFSFVFSLFGLLMGLALAEVIGGFGTILEARHRVRVGWLSPLLALLIAFDLTSFWMVAWQIRESIPVNFISLMVGLFIFGIYYLIAQLAFPDDLELWPDLDAYYWRHKRLLLGGMYACNLVALAGSSTSASNRSAMPTPCMPWPRSRSAWPGRSCCPANGSTPSSCCTRWRSIRCSRSSGSWGRGVRRGPPNPPDAYSSFFSGFQPRTMTLS